MDNAYFLYRKLDDCVLMIEKRRQVLCGMFGPVDVCGTDIARDPAINEWHEKANIIIRRLLGCAPANAQPATDPMVANPAFKAPPLPVKKISLTAFNNPC